MGVRIRADDAGITCHRRCCTTVMCLALGAVVDFGSGTAADDGDRCVGASRWGANGGGRHTVRRVAFDGTTAALSVATGAVTVDVTVAIAPAIGAHLRTRALRCCPSPLLGCCGVLQQMRWAERARRWRRRGGRADCSRGGAPSTPLYRRGRSAAAATSTVGE